MAFQGFTCFLLSESGVKNETWYRDQAFDAESKKNNRILRKINFDHEFRLQRVHCPELESNFFSEKLLFLD